MQREVHDVYFLQTLTPLWKLRRHYHHHHFIKSFFFHMYSAGKDYLHVAKAKQGRF